MGGRSLTGDDILNNSLTGADIDEGTLAVNAAQLGGLDATAFTQGGGKVGGLSLRVAADRGPVFPRRPLFTIPGVAVLEVFADPRIESVDLDPGEERGYGLSTRAIADQTVFAEELGWSGTFLVSQPPGVAVINAGMHLDDEFDSVEVSCDFPVTYRTHP